MHYVRTYKLREVSHVHLFVDCLYLSVVGCTTFNFGLTLEDKKG